MFDLFYQMPKRMRLIDSLTVFSGLQKFLNSRSLHFKIYIARFVELIKILKFNDREWRNIAIHKKQIRESVSVMIQ